MPPEPLPLSGNETGIDVGLTVFLITADGEIVDNPRQYRKAEQQLAKAPRRGSRRKQGSKRRAKAGAQLAKKQPIVRRQRVDLHHKTALALVPQYDTIYLDEVQVRTMVRNRHLAKSIADAGWAAFRAIFACKAACAGKRVIAVLAQYTSQEGSGGGERVPKSLSVRSYGCPSCGLVIDRDENAAKTILRAGQARQGAVALAAAMN